MNPIQLQLQSEAAPQQLQQKPAEKLSTSPDNSFESALRKADDSKAAEVSKNTESPAENSAPERPEKTDRNEKVAKKDAPKKTDDCDKADDAEKVPEIEDISVKIEQLQVAAQNRNADVPDKLPEVYEDFVVTEAIGDEFKVDAENLNFVASETIRDISRDEDFDTSEIEKLDINEILAKASDSIEEKSAKSEKMAADGIRNIQELAKSELGLGENELSEIVFDAEKFQQLAETVSELADSKISKNSPTDSDEAKAKTKKGANIAVHDLRGAKISESGLPQSKVVAKVQDASKSELNLKQTQENSVQISMEMAAKGQVEQNITSSSAQTAGANGSTFQQMLSNAVQANAPEIVKAGNMVLKDNNTGSINLILKPENLGNVKISLNLSDKVISGQITVASKEAFDAFRESIDTIKQAFTESGFDTGAFDLNFSQGNDFAQSNQSQGENFGNQIQGERTYREFAADISSEGTSDLAYDNFSDASVNIVA